MRTEPQGSTTERPLLNKGRSRCAIVQLEGSEDVEPDDVHWLQVAGRAGYEGDRTGELVTAIERGRAEFYRVSGSGRGIFVLQALVYQNGMELSITGFAGKGLMRIAPQILEFSKQRAREIGARWFSVYTEDPRLSHWLERRGRMPVMKRQHLFDLGGN